jgi:hypothetical protein
MYSGVVFLTDQLVCLLIRHWAVSIHRSLGSVLLRVNVAHKIVAAILKWMIVLRLVNELVVREG